MIYFTLPNFHECINVNRFFMNLSKSKAYMFKEPVSFIQVSGGIPYGYWTGSFSTMHGPGALQPDLVKINSQVGAPIRLILDNIALEEFDYDNTFANVILDSFHNGANYIEIANIELMDRLKEKYPNYKFIFSPEADLIVPFTEDLLNQILDFNQFEQIRLPKRLYGNTDFLKEIKSRNKLEVTVNSPCNLTCKNYSNCRIAQHLAQLEFSKQEIIPMCQKAYTNDVISLEQIVDYYIPLGINHFTFENFSTNVYTENSLVAFYIDYFIQPEYQYTVLKNWLGREVMLRNGH